MAPRRVQIVLAVEVAAPWWPTNYSACDTQAYPRDEHCQSAVGSAADPWRTPQDRHRPKAGGHSSAITLMGSPRWTCSSYRQSHFVISSARRLVNCGAWSTADFMVWRTAHPTADWTLQQFREALPGDHRYSYVIHDRDRIYSKELDRAVKSMGVRVLRTPVRSPKANCFCERLVRTARRECLDFLIPFSEAHLRCILREWVSHSNHGRPHKCLGPGIPAPIIPAPASLQVATRYLVTTE